MTSRLPPMALAGRIAIVTGASQGLGAEIARHYVNAGASILACARSAADLDVLAAELKALCKDGQRVVVQPADVAKAADLDALVARALKEFDHVDILVNNAGVYGPLGSIETIDWGAWVRAIEINLMGTVYACRAVLPTMKARRYGKIVNLSGGGATNPLPNITAYAASKAAVVRFTESLALEVSGQGIDVNAIAPGALATRLLDEAIAAGPQGIGGDFHQRMLKIKAEGGTPLARGAELVVYLGSAASDGITGKLIAALWDPWSSLAEHHAELAGSDIYTLRRITPEDRGKRWGKT